MAVDHQSILPIITACATLFFGLAAIVWNIYNKASMTQAADVKALHDKITAEVKVLNEKIDSNTAHCVNKQRDIQMISEQNKESIQLVRSELSQAIMDHKVETINRQDANSLMEEKIKPIRDSVEEIKNDTRATNAVLSKVLQSLGRIEGSMGIQSKRSEDY